MFHQRKENLVLCKREVLAFEEAELAQNDRLLVLEFLQARRQGLRRCAGLDSPQHVRNGLLIVCQLLLVEGNLRGGIVLALLRRVYLPRKLFKNVLLKDVADSKVDHGALEAVTRDLLLIASLILAASVPTIIVVPFVPALARAADSLHWPFTVTAEESTG